MWVEKQLYIVCEWELVFSWQECRQTEQGALTGGGFTDPAEHPKRSTWFLTTCCSSSVCSACFGLTVRGSDLFIRLPQIRSSNFHLYLNIGIIFAPVCWFPLKQHLLNSVFQMLQVLAEINYSIVFEEVKPYLLNLLHQKQVKIYF